MKNEEPPVIDVDPEPDETSENAIAVSAPAPVRKDFRLRYGLGITVNPGNYQSVRVDVAMEIGFENDANLDGIFDALQAEVRRRVDKATKDELLHFVNGPYYRRGNK